MTAEKDSPSTFYIQGILIIFNVEILEPAVTITRHNAVSRSDNEDAEDV